MMASGSPAPQWEVLHEPTPSSDSEDEIDSDNILHSPLKRKADSKLPPTTTKRVKLTPQLSDDRAILATTPNPRPIIRLNQIAVAGPSKLPAAQDTGPSHDPSSIPAKISSLQNLNIPTSSTLSKQRKIRKYSTGSADGLPGYDSASSPPASPAPPPVTPILPTKISENLQDKSRPSSLSSLFQDRMRRPYSSSYLRSSPPPTQKPKLKSQPRSSMSTSHDVHDVIEISDDESKNIPEHKPKRPLHRPTKSLSASVPVSGEVIELSDDDSPTTSSGNKSKSKVISKSKVASTEPSKLADAPPSTLRIRIGKSKIKNESTQPPPTLFSGHSVSRRVEGMRLQKKESEVIVVLDSDEEESMPGSGASASGVKARQPAPLRLASSPRSIPSPAQDKVMRDPSPDPDPVPCSRSQLPHPPQAGGSLPFPSEQDQDARPRTAPDTDKPTNYATKLGDAHMQASSAAAATNGGTINTIINENAILSSSEPTVINQVILSTKAPSNAGADTAVPVQVTSKPVASAKGDDAMDVDCNVSKSNRIPPSVTLSVTPSAKIPDAKVDDHSSMGSNLSIRTSPDTAVRIYSAVVQMPPAANSPAPTQPPRPTSSGSELSGNSTPEEASSSSGSISVAKSYGSFWSSGIWSSGRDKHTSSPPQESGGNLREQEKMPTSRTMKQSSGMDVQTVEVSLMVASSPGPVMPAPASPASTTVTSSEETQALGTVAPTAGSFSSTSVTAPTIRSTSVSGTAATPASELGLSSQRPSKAMATTGPVSQLPSKSATVPSYIPQSDAVPMSNASSLPGRLPRRPSSSSSVSEEQSRAASPTQRPPSRLSSSSSLAKEKSSMAHVPTSEPMAQRSISPTASATSSHTRATSASSSQPRTSLADVITQASQSNVRISPKRNRFSKHDAIDLRHDSNDSDVEMARPSSLDRSIYEDAIASAELLQILVQPGSSPRSQYLHPQMDEVRASVSTPSPPESRGIAATSPVPPLPRRSTASPKKPASVDEGPAKVSTLANDKARGGLHPSTSTSESVALAISSNGVQTQQWKPVTTSESVAQAISSNQRSTLSPKPHNNAQAQRRKTVSTSESVAQAMFSNQTSVLSTPRSAKIPTGGDNRRVVAQGENIAHAISSRSSALPASQKHSQTKSDVATIVPPSTSENVARAISSKMTSVPAGRALDNPPILAPPERSLSDQMNPTSSTSTPDATSHARSRQMAPQRRPSLPSKNPGGSSSVSCVPAQQPCPLSSLPNRESTLSFNSRTTATDQPLDGPTSGADLPLVRSFSSSTLILTPAPPVSGTASSESAPPGSFTVSVSKRLPSTAPHSASSPDRRYTPTELAPESSRNVSSNLDASAAMAGTSESAMNVDQDQNDISPATIDEASPDSDSDSEVEKLLVTSTVPSPEVSPPFEKSAALASSSVPVTSTVASSPVPLGITSDPGVGENSVDDLLQGQRRSSRLSSRSASRSSSNDPMDIIPDEELTSAESPPSHSPTPGDISGPTPIRTYGGFPSLNWQTYRQDINNFTPKCYYAKDLPHTLQDHINRWPESARLQPQMRHVLQSSILENTADDEPDAPYIDIINSVDHEPTPPWEFHYSNKMWHTDGVPPPDVTRLASCNCMGKCDPKSKTCACVKRQQQYSSDVYADFAYDKNGRLKVPGPPIFECNDLCGCDDECRNRVVQHGRTVAISICKTKDKGWGVFAGPRKIYNGTFIGIYAGELLTDEVGEERGKKYNAFGRTYLFDLDFYYLKGENEHDWDVKYVVDAYHTGNFTRFLNHSCDPNCQLVPCYINESNIDKPLLTVFARRDIEAGEELCFSYNGNYDDDSDEKGAPSSPPANTDNQKKSDQVYATCRCGASKCTGQVFS